MRDVRMSFSWRWDRQSICGEETMGCESVTSQLTEVAKLRRCDGRRDLVQNGTPRSFRSVASHNAPIATGKTAKDCCRDLERETPAFPTAFLPLASSRKY